MSAITYHTRTVDTIKGKLSHSGYDCEFVVEYNGFIYVAKLYVQKDLSFGTKSLVVPKAYVSSGVTALAEFLGHEFYMLILDVEEEFKQFASA